jgi:hypothetical protein
MRNSTGRRAAIPRPQARNRAIVAGGTVGVGLVVAACSGTQGPSQFSSSSTSHTDAGIDVSRPDARPAQSLDGALAEQDAAAVEASPEAAEPEAAAEAAVEAGPPESFFRIANWTPDAPSSGYDVCLAPAGTTAWTGPLLAADLPSGSLGAGPANGVQFPLVTAYLAVAPGRYDLQLVMAGATDCSTGVVAETTGLPILVAGARTTFAVTGDVMPIDDDSAQKVGAFPDDVAPLAAGGVTARLLDAVPSAAAVVAGTGDVQSGSFAPIWPDAQFASTPMTIADGGTTDFNGYAVIPPLSSTEVSAHAIGATKDLAIAAHVTAAAGIVVTFAIINGKNGGRPPQFLMCHDDQPPRGALSPCDVLIGQ